MPDSPPIFFQGEVMLAGWGESHNGGAKLTLWLPDPSDLDPFRSVTMKKGKIAGQRFMMVLVEIGEDETPVAPQKHHHSSDAHLMVTGAAFVNYVRDTIAGASAWDAAQCRMWAKHSMQVDSLSELDTDPAALKRFHEIIRRPFEEWMERDDDRPDES